MQRKKYIYSLYLLVHLWVFTQKNTFILTRTSVGFTLNFDTVRIDMQGIEISDNFLSSPYDSKKYTNVVPLDSALSSSALSSSTQC